MKGDNPLIFSMFHDGVYCQPEKQIVCLEQKGHQYSFDDGVTNEDMDLFNSHRTLFYCSY